ncbi:hypothetical protein BT96DRAFT_427196 [Gymnopus androsaceus JB14]|uniref:Serine-threonine/tyrosine-protein kinase catalytic domain-containing protein n=1 Tax=Gymnopus androsaceus JB14 TaxID=1447944 RepID=A0A6A4I1L1_9AGAR|nr:hypothetical protein BT96DRAFT_427196 [Gymnopus androsaceus JB14]
MLGERPARPQNVWYPDRIWDLTTRCWTEQPASRPTAQEISDFLQIALTDLSSSTSLNQEETIIGVSGLDSSDLDSLAESSQSAELEPPELQRGRSFAYRSWATWQPDPNLMPTPPSSEESLIVLSLRSRHDSIESLALPAWAQIHPGGERRETIRTAISMLWKEMSTPPEYMRQTDSGKRDWDGVELRMARLSTCIEASSMPGDRQVEVIFSKALQDGFVLCMCVVSFPTIIN